MAGDRVESSFQITSDPAARDSSTDFPLDGRDIYQVPEAELAAVAETAPALHALCGARVARISRGLVIKKSPVTLPSEAEAMRLVAQKTRVRLPQVYRSFTVYDTGGIYDATGYIVMSYIEGICLSECWDVLPREQRDRLSGQVADIVQQLQSLEMPVPGPIGGGPSQGTWFSDYGSGPFTDAQDFEDYFNRRLEMAKKTRNTPLSTPPFRCGAFVMTHLDIAPRNLILDPHGRLHLVDWAHAGAYPPIFEAGAIAVEWQHPTFSPSVLQQLDYNPQELQQLMSLRGVLHFLDETDFDKLDAWMKGRRLLSVNKSIDPEP